MLAPLGAGPAAPPTSKTIPDVELLGLPWPEPVLDLIGELRWVRRGPERLPRQYTRRLVVLTTPLPVRAHPGHDIGPDRTDHPDEVAEDLLPPPLLEGFLDAERVAEVDRAGEVLLGTVESVSCQQLLCSQHRKRVEQLGAYLVLPTITTSGGDQRRANPLTLTQHRQQRVVLIVWVRRRHHEDADSVQPTEHQAELDLSALRDNGLCLEGPGRGGVNQGERQDRGEEGNMFRLHENSSIHPQSRG